MRCRRDEKFILGSGGNLGSNGSSASSVYSARSEDNFSLHHHSPAAIVDLARSGKSEKEVKKQIEKARVKVFDLSSAATEDLKMAGVTAATLDEMHEAMRDMQHGRKPRSRWWTLGILYLAMFYPYLILL
jgi:hypothetical protein